MRKLLWLALLVSAAHAAELKDGFGFRDAPRRLRVNEPMTVTLDLPTDYADPLDPSEIAVDATIRTPKRTWVYPCYYDQDYRRELAPGADGRLAEQLVPEGLPAWKLRFTAAEPGPYEFRVTARDRTRTVTSLPLRLSATSSSTPGYIRLSPDSAYPYRERRRPRPVIGINLCWAGPAGTFDYDTWLTRMGGSGIDYARLWLWSPQRTFDLEAAPGRTGGPWDLRGAWRLDYVIERGAVQGLNFVACLAPVPLLPAGADAAWFGTPAAREQSLRRVRYLLARFGAYPNLSAFELVARAAQVDEALLGWLDPLATWLREHDAAQRLVCASALPGLPAAALARDKLIDFVTVELPSPEQVPAAVREAVLGVGRPTLVSAQGFGNRSRELADRDGVRLHDGLWAGVMSGGIGGAMPWWWDSQIHRHGLYQRFHALYTFAQAVTWDRLSRFTGCRLATPGWSAMAVQGSRQVLAWVYPDSPAAERPTELLLATPRPGLPTVRLYDPWTEAWLKPTALTRTNDGLSLGLPASRRDLAVVLTWSEPAG